MTSPVALVTGANKGIGREIAAQLADHGLTVLLAARDPGRLADAAAELAARGDVRPLQLDVTDQRSVSAAAARIAAEIGHLDVLVNNAGITGGSAQQPGDVDLAAVEAAYAVNVLGVIRVTEAMLPLLRRAPVPRIVNMSSSVGSLARMTDPAGPLAEMPASAAYVTSKTALNSVTVQYAKALRGQVEVTAACPGYCATDLNGHRGHRSAAQGAAIAVRLATGADGERGGGFYDEDGPVGW
jgi:NAD(P)-dependent dehydrogenase (short-subunit alcohol dehydrogenase family)